MDRRQTVLWIALTPLASSHAGPLSDAQRIAMARDLNDNYYGQPGHLARAAELLQPVMLKKVVPAAAYMEASFLTYQGGHIVSEKFAPGTLELSEYLVDRALAMEPSNVRAISMKTMLLLKARRSEEFVATANRGLKLDPNDLWLNLQMADYYRERKQTQQALKIWDAFYDRGPGRDSEQKRAFCYATLKLLDVWGAPNNGGRMREFAARADAARHPDDAWTLGEISRQFTFATLFDDAIAYGKKSLAVMNYGIGRLQLAVAWYGKAAQRAQLLRSYDDELREARAVGVDPRAVRDWYVHSTPYLQLLLPALDKML